MENETSLTVKSAPEIHRTTPIKSSLSPVPGYPTKLTIYLLAASPYWWVRYYVEKKIFRKSTRESDKRRAFAFAKKFYDELNFKQHSGMIRSKADSFEACARAVVEQQEFTVKRGEMSAEMCQADKYRLEKEILPFFREFSIKDVDYFLLERFLNKLTNDKLHGSTISNYLGLISKTLKYAQRRGYIVAVPQIPKPVKLDSPRGWFTLKEYRKVWEAARRMSGHLYEVRKRIAADDKDEIFACQRLMPTQAERAKAKRESAPAQALTKAQLSYQAMVAGTEVLRRVEMTPDTYDLIVFMVNSFIRPTDIKWMKHKHVEQIDEQHVFLRLRLPTSKKHNKPIVTMSSAVRVYKRIVERNKPLGLIGPEDYVFMPQFGKNDKDREKALTLLQRQFGVILADTGLEKGPNGEDRSLYSLRHSCIMYRLLYGDGMDLLTLARNARTSTEMIERFYAADLHGEQNIDMIQSRRAKKPTSDQVRLAGLIEQMSDEKINELLAQRALRASMTSQSKAPTDPTPASAPVKATARISKKAPAPARKVAAKYRDPVSGMEWSGRGMSPKWIGSRDKNDFLIAD